MTSISTVFRGDDRFIVHDLNGVNVPVTPYSDLCHYSAIRMEVVEWATTVPSLIGAGPCTNGWIYIEDVVNKIQDPCGMNAKTVVPLVWTVPESVAFKDMSKMFHCG